MSLLFTPRVIETVYEDTAYGWIYQFIETIGKGVLVKRTPVADLPLWSHGVITQIFDLDANKFVPAVKSGSNYRIADMKTAQEVVEEFAFDEK